MGLSVLIKQIKAYDNCKKGFARNCIMNGKICTLKYYKASFIS